MRRYFIVTIGVLLLTTAVVFGYWFSGGGEFAADRSSLLLFGCLLPVVFGVAWLFPREMFWLFMATLPLENIVWSLNGLPVGFRPYQFLEAILWLVLLLGLMIKNKRINFDLYRGKCILFGVCRRLLRGGNKKRNFGERNLGVRQGDDKKTSRKNRQYFNPLDRLVLVLGVASFVSVQFAPDKIVALKMAVVFFSYVMLYLLVRNFVRTGQQLLEAVWFFLIGSGAVILFAFYQALAIKFNWLTFTVMDKRVNSTFMEPDWLGMYLVLVIAIIFGFKYLFEVVAKDEEGRLLPRVADLRIFNLSAPLVGQVLLDIILGIFVLILILTVSRSAWLGGVGVFGLYLVILWLKLGWQRAWREGILLSVAVIGAIFLLRVGGLSDFHLGNRAVSSVSGLQKITVSCLMEDALQDGAKINSVDDLNQYDCRHINLEEIEREREQGHVVKEVFRPDPNVEIRKNIYKLTWDKIRERWLFGHGLGMAGYFLGQDDLGHDLNTSNIFLEALFSWGVVGFLPFLLLFLTPGILGLKMLQVRAGRYSDKKREVLAVFCLLTFVAVLIPNLFNAGLFLSVLWAWLAVVVSAVFGELA